MLRSVVVLGVLAVASRASAGGMFVPPLEVEVGVVSIASSSGPSAIARQWMVGVSWASGNPRSPLVDVSIGVISTSQGGPPRPTESVDATGGFLDVALGVRTGRHWRTWAGVRGELMGTEGVGILGLTGRASAELWRGVNAEGRNSILLGAFALTAWVELGIRERPDRSLARTAAAGLGVRLPMFFLR